MSEKTASSKVNNKINATTKETDNAKKLFSQNNTYLVFGCGVTGQSAVSFCQMYGLPFYITGDDKKTLQTLRVNDVDVEEANKLYDYNEKILKEKHIDYIILSPHIKTQKDQHKIVEIAKNIGAEIISDVDLFYSYLIQYNEMQYEKAKQDNKQYTEKKLIGITGTNGKSTTTALVAHILNENGKPAVACGNIGVNPLSFTEEEVKKYDYFVVEMSSYNLVISKYVNFDVGGLINISPDHLDYHGTMEEYIKAKMKIFDLSERKVSNIEVENFDEENSKNTIQFVYHNVLKLADEEFYNRNKDICAFLEKNYGFTNKEKEEYQIGQVKRILALIEYCHDQLPKYLEHAMTLSNQKKRYLKPCLTIMNDFSDYLDILISMLKCYAGVKDERDLKETKIIILPAKDYLQVYIPSYVKKNNILYASYITYDILNSLQILSNKLKHDDKDVKNWYNKTNNYIQKQFPTEHYLRYIWINSPDNTYDFIMSDEDKMFDKATKFIEKATYFMYEFFRSFVISPLPVGSKDAIACMLFKKPLTWENDDKYYGCDALRIFPFFNETWRLVNAQQNNLYFIPQPLLKYTDNGLCFNGVTLHEKVNNDYICGSHNNQNIVVAIGITHFCGVDFKQAFEAIKTFQGLGHRLQLIKTIDGVEFVNDSKGTNANSTEQALKAYKDYDVYLIAGGRRKEEGFLALKPYLACVKCVFLIGEATESFAKELDELSITYVKCGTMDVAVDNAFEMAKNNVNNNKKRVVLLSPLCASFDQYKRFEERGDDFCKIVDRLNKH